MATIIRDKIKQPDGKNFKLLDAVDVEHIYTDDNGDEQVTSVADYLESLTEDVKSNATSIASLGDTYYTESEVDELLDKKVDNSAIEGMATENYVTNAIKDLPTKDFVTGAIGDAAYTLPTATEKDLGGVKVGAGLKIENEVLSVDVVNNLTSESADKALSAAQGKALKDQLDGILDDIGELGYGDMLKSVYDKNNDGIVDKAEDSTKLDGHAADYFATAEGVGKLSEDLDKKYVKPTNGIPKTDLDAAVQASLVKADTAIQSLDGYATTDSVYNKTDADAKFFAKADVETTLEPYAKTEDVNKSLDGKVNKTDMDSYYTKTEIDGTGYAVETIVESTYAKKSDVNVALGNKADKSELHSHDNKNELDKITEGKVAAWDNKVDKETGKGLSVNDFTDDYKAKLENIEAGANKITVDKALSETSENPVQNKVVQATIKELSDGKVDKAEGSRLITEDEAAKLNALVLGDGGKVEISGKVNASNVEGLSALLAGKVDVVANKGLSTNDYTTADKEKLAGIAEGATAVIVDATLSDTSYNAIQNKAVTTETKRLAALIQANTDAVSNITHPVTSVNTKTGDVVLTADDIDLSAYYTSAQTDTKIEDAIKAIPDVDLSSYYTSQQTDTKIEEAVSAIVHPTVDLTPYAKTTDVDTKLATKAESDHTHEEYLEASDIVGFATTEYVNGQLETKANTVHEHNEYLVANDISGKADTTYVDEQLNLKAAAEHSHDQYLEESDIADLATQEFVTTKIAEAKLAASDVDLSGYYTKSETDEQIEAAIESIEHPTVDLAPYATKNELSTAVSGKADKATTLEGYGITDAVNKTEQQTALNSLKSELSESIVSESTEWIVADENGNIVAKVDDDGLTTTAVIANIVTVDGTNVKTALNAVNTQVDKIISGETVVYKSTNDASGNVITTTYETKTDAAAKLEEAKSYAEGKVAGLASTSSVNNAINTHNTSSTAHGDIRELISAHSDAITEELTKYAKASDMANKADKSELHVHSNKTELDKIVDGKVASWDNKVDKISGMGLSTNDFTADYKAKLENIADGANKTIVDDAFSNTSINPVQNKVISAAIDSLSENKVDKVDGSRLITASEASKLNSLVLGDDNQVQISGKVNASNVEGLDELLAGKVDIVAGKGLSTNDYTTSEKEKLAGIENGATAVLVDETLSDTSFNAIQNKAVANEVKNLRDLINSTSDAINGITHPVTSVNNKTGNVVLAASDIDMSEYYTKGEADDKVTTAIANKADKTELHSHENKDVLDNITEGNSGELIIADLSGNIIFKSNQDGFATTTLKANNVVVNGVDIQDELNKKANAADVYSKANIDDTFLKQEDASNTYVTKQEYSDQIEGALQTYAKTSDLAKKVDNTRKINGQALSKDITLTAADVGALPSDTVIPSIAGLATTSEVNNLLSEKVDNATKINGHELTGDVTLDADDVGALSETTIVPLIAGFATKTEVETALAGKSDDDHIHDDKYYTKANIDGKIDTINASVGKNTTDIDTHIKAPNIHVTEDDRTILRNASNIKDDGTGAFNIADNNKNIIARVDQDGLFATTVWADNVILDSANIKDIISTKVDKVDGSRLITSLEADKLNSLVLGDNGQVEISGKVNAANVQGLDDWFAERIDTSLDVTSTNPVQNKIVATEVGNLRNYITQQVDSKFDAAISYTDEALETKVDKVEGKGLSTNDFTNEEKEKLADLKQTLVITVDENGVADKTCIELVQTDSEIVLQRKISGPFGDWGQFNSFANYTYCGVSISAQFASLNFFGTYEDKLSLCTVTGSVANPDELVTVTFKDGCSIEDVIGLQDALDSKVNKEDGKGLSANDFTDAYKEMVEKTKERADDTWEKHKQLNNDFINHNHYVWSKNNYNIEFLFDDVISSPTCETNSELKQYLPLQYAQTLTLNLDKEIELSELIDYPLPSYTSDDRDTIEVSLWTDYLRGRPGNYFIHPVTNEICKMIGITASSTSTYVSFRYRVCNGFNCLKGDFVEFLYSFDPDEYIKDDFDDEYWYAFLGTESLISSETASLLNVEDSPTADAALNQLGQYNTHWWKRVGPIVGYEEDIKNISSDITVLDTTDTSGRYINYSKSVDIDQYTGEVSLTPVNGAVDHLSWTYTTGTTAGKEETLRFANELLALAPVYISNTAEGGSEIYYIPAGATVGNETTDTLRYASAGSTKSSALYLDSSATVKAQSVGSTVCNTDFIEPTYVHSKDRNAYEDNQVIDGLMHKYIGIPFENMISAPKIEHGCYVGTGLIGKDNPNTLTFEFEPKFVVIEHSSTSLLRLMVAIRGVTRSGLGTESGTSDKVIEYTWDGNSLSWYFSDSDVDANNQFNKSGIAYYYVAFG